MEMTEETPAKLNLSN
jgi:hypothetical protein